MNPTYNELTITLKNQGFVELIADYIATVFDEGVEIGENKVIVRSDNDLHAIEKALEEFDGVAMKFVYETKENQDWIQKYKDSIEPIEAGIFYIYPSWYSPKEGFVNIKIDPALAFGSGHHATTFSCLQALSTLIKPDDTVLDVGCGSGILGLAATKLGATVDLCDTDLLSVESTKENFALNNAEYRALWEGSANKTTSNYTIVVANIIADVLKFIPKELKRAVKIEGYLILSGILDKKESSVLPYYQELVLIDRKLKDEWVTLVYKKQS